MRAALRAFAEMAVEGRKFWRWGRCWSWGRGRRRSIGGWEELARGIGRGGGGVAGDADGYVGGGGGAGRGAGGGGGGECTVASSHAQAAAWLRARLRPGDALLLKASRSIQIEKF